MKQVFKNAKVGDRVWSSIRGWGVVYCVHQRLDYPLYVEFKGKDNKYVFSYTFDGFYYESHKCPELYWQEPEVKYAITEKPQPDINWLKVPPDTRVQVRDDDEVSTWVDAIFALVLPLSPYKYIVFHGDSMQANATCTQGWRYCILHPDVVVREEWLL